MKLKELWLSRRQKNVTVLQGGQEIKGSFYKMGDSRACLSTDGNRLVVVEEADQ